MTTGTQAASAPRADRVVHPLPDPGSEARIGPNSVMRTLQALEERHGPEMASRLHRRAGLPAHRWTALIPEVWFVDVIRELRTLLPEDEADEILRRAGALTGDYVRDNRVPAVFRRLLGILPSRWALPLLLRAFRRHAWTFAGSGRFRYEGAYPPVLVLEGAPTCRSRGRPEGSGSYYEAAFETLLALAAPGIRVREVACQATGDPACRFELLLPSQLSSRRP